jgi:thiol-disulfide isomerase/thioredoxin
VLDFWATSCHPCRSALRDLEALLPYLTRERAAVYAVNLGEPREKVAAFVAKMGVGLPVALDSKGELAEQLRIEAIPTSVIIGTDGSIQAVHVGYDKGFIPGIRREIGGLCEGRNLAEEHCHVTSGSQLRQRLRLDSKAYCAVFVGY